ncbi:hypothetical protein NDI51_09220 [Microcoleus vaginatus GB1-A3]
MRQIGAFGNHLLQLATQMVRPGRSDLAAEWRSGAVFECRRGRILVLDNCGMILIVLWDGRSSQKACIFRAGGTANPQEASSNCATPEFFLVSWDCFLRTLLGRSPPTELPP